MVLRRLPAATDFTPSLDSLKSFIAAFKYKQTLFVKDLRYQWTVIRFASFAVLSRGDNFQLSGSKYSRGSTALWKLASRASLLQHKKHNKKAAEILGAVQERPRIRVDEM
jgi:hypothetical protein